jgi:hypothetical protein
MVWSILRVLRMEIGAIAPVIGVSNFKPWTPSSGIDIGFIGLRSTVESKAETSKKQISSLIPD